MQKYLYISLFLLTIVHVLCTPVHGQINDTINIQDTIKINPADSVIFPLVNSDSLSVKEKKENSDISSEVKYSATDSMIFGMNNRKVFLYHKGIVTYQDIELTANYIEFDMEENQVFARGTINDTTKKYEGLPIFKQGNQTFNAQSIKYNFKTKKGFIEAVKTEQEGGYLHSEVTKKDEYGHIHMKDGKYTTCDKDDPDFYLALTKAKSIPGDKIISGPAYLVIADVPLPIGLPFGFFPTTKSSTSGVLIPSYGEENLRGFYLTNGGYYWAINDYLDLGVTGDIYTNGTWGIRANTNYRLRYKFNGGFSGRYFKNITGDKGLGEGLYGESYDYSINWVHNQDSKANPTRQFRASVNLSTRGFDRTHSQILTNALTNTKQSSISFQKRWEGTPFNFSATANHSQNSQTGNVDLNLPKVALNMATIYPFKSKEGVSKKWYESIQLTYNASFDNKIRTTDTSLFKPAEWKSIQTGFTHNINPAYNIKLKKFKILTITPNLRYTGYIYPDYIRKYRDQVITPDTSYYKTVTDTVHQLTYAHAYYPSLNMSLAPKIYGLFQFGQNSKISAIRHVISPTIGMTLIPDMKSIAPNYYEDVVDENGKVIENYSRYSNALLGAPPRLNRATRTMSFRLNNTLEAKVREVSDTSETFKKVKILENLNFSTNLNFDDSIKFQPISMSGSTRFLNNKVNVTFRGTFDPYALGDGHRINVSNYKVNGKLARMTNANISLGTNFASKAKKKSESTDRGGVIGATDDRATVPGVVPDSYDEDYYYGQYVDFDIPWSIRADYSLNYSKPVDKVSIVQTLRFSGDFSLTPNWKIGYNTGYDLKMNKITTSNISIYRDLHCWEMTLTAVPFGIYKSFNFEIHVKSAVLKDLKYDKRIPWQDNFR